VSRSSDQAKDSPARSVSEAPAFRVRIGPGRSGPRPKLKNFIGRIKAMVKEQGGSRARRSHGGRGGSAAARLPFRTSPQRVVIKTRIINHGKYASARAAAAALREEVAYLSRRSASVDGEEGVAFDDVRTLTREDLREFREALAPDRHHFRIMVSPENGADLDLPSFAREFVKEMETDLGTRLQWFGVAHYDTDEPHLHLLVRGKDASGKDLVISRDYISHGMRLQAGEVATRRLGPRRAEDIERSLTKEITAERITPLDRSLDAQKALHPRGWVTALRGREGTISHERTRLRTLARLQHLESLGLAREVAAGIWEPDAQLLPRLKAMSIRGDIVKTLHARATGKPYGLDPLILDRERPLKAPVVGSVMQRARVDEFWDHEYLLIDGANGRQLYVPLAIAHVGNGSDPKVGSVVRLEAAAAGKGSQTLKVTEVSRDLGTVLKVDGVTFLDRELAREGLTKLKPLAQGFEAEYADALKRRAAHLESLGLADIEGGQWRARAGWLDTLYERELTATQGRLGTRFGDLKILKEGQHFRGTVQGVEDLSSGAHVVIAGGGRYALVPASKTLNDAVGRRVHLNVFAPLSPVALEPQALQRSIEIHVLNRSRGL
jgi:type IV secretory pathway VirD2 relaxase